MVCRKYSRKEGPPAKVSKTSIASEHRIQLLHMISSKQPDSAQNIVPPSIKQPDCTEHCASINWQTLPSVPVDKVNRCHEIFQDCLKSSDNRLGQRMRTSTLKCGGWKLTLEANSSTRTNEQGWWRVSYLQHSVDKQSHSYSPRCLSQVALSSYRMSILFSYHQLPLPIICIRMNEVRRFS
jgi:hypothetical protein